MSSVFINTSLEDTDQWLSALKLHSKALKKPQTLVVWSNPRESFFFFFGLFRVASAAYGGSQARGLIRTVAIGLCHSNEDPLSEATDGTHNLKVPSRICFCCAMTGTPRDS